MNPHLCRVVLRPRGPFEVFDLTVRLIRQHAAVYLRLGAVMVLPPAALGILGAVLAGGSWWVLLPVALLFPVVQLPFTVLSGRLLFAADVTAREVLREVVTRPGAAMVATLWHLLAFWGGLFTCGLALPISLPASAYVTEGALLERVGAGRSLKRSMRLAGSNPGIAMAASLGQLGLTAWGAAVGEATGQGVVGFVLQLGQPFGTVFDGLLTPYIVLGVLAAAPRAAPARRRRCVDPPPPPHGGGRQGGLRAAGLGTTR